MTLIHNQMMKKLLLALFTFSVAIAFSQTTYVPDDNFEQVLIDSGYDDVLDDYVATAELTKIIQLDLNQSGVIDLTGLEALSKLEWLRLDNLSPDAPPIDEIDVSQNVNLETLLLPGNNIKVIDLSKNKKLRGLNLRSNQLETIDLSYNPDLQSVVLDNNKLLELDLSNNVSLVLYILSNNELTRLNLQNGNNLNFAESVELAGNPNLECIQVDDAEFSSNNQYWIKDDSATFSEECSPIPDHTYIPDNSFEQALIDLGYDDLLDDYVLTSNIESVLELNFYENSIIDLTGLQDFKALEVLNCGENYRNGAYINELDISFNTNLKELYCSSTLLTSLDISNNLLLETLSIPFSFIENIDVSANSNLIWLDIGSSKLSELDISMNLYLKTLIISYTDIYTLNLENNLLLEELNLSGTSIDNVDISKQKNLKKLNVKQMSSLTQLNLVENNSIQSLEARYNPSLICIQVTDVEIATAQSQWLKDDTATYSEDCSDTATDSDNDGIPDDLDQCSDTKAGVLVDENGCELSIADLVLENIQISIGSDPCSEEPSCYISMRSLKNIPLDIYIESANHEPVFVGILNSENPIELNELVQDDYTILVVGNEFPPIDYGWLVSFNSENNQIETTVGITKPDQTYSIGVSGSTTYLVDINGTTTTMEFGSVEEQQLEIPLIVGVNKITVNGVIECDVTDDTEEEEEEEDDGSGKSVDNLNLFPTLSDGLITIENTNEKHIHGITVSSINGILTKYIPISGNPKEMTIDMKGAAKGMYIVRIQQASGKPILKKILIK